ncbi:hypothetical protein [Leucothrix pacifica]|uniref:Uncharacterized protein n=1 Tax=Leucothrix pacifica TaxID=1247513 RepID=A0A317C0E8_9GAMM|nr:hypothetical protein [Leucothrix pacifica]PWQ92028.1 hypothetical protein DKW60_23305 [Leucothrix pacifica]
MKGIILFFMLIFTLVGAGVFFYETQVAAPRAGAILKKQLANPKNNTETPKVVKTNPQPKATQSEILTALNDQATDFRVNTTRIIDLNSPYESEGVDLKEQETLIKDLDESVKQTIQRSIRLDIQKAVASEISRQR